MNVFYLDEDPARAAAYHCDKHVLKMLVETAQMLSTAHRVLSPETSEGLYKKTHENHPSNAWVRSGYQNYLWTWRLLFNLCKEYTRRYGKTHKVETELLWKLRSAPDSLSYGVKFTEPPQCMPDSYKRESAVEAYRAYYVGDKARFAKWKLGDSPSWWPTETVYNPPELV